jgi:hypothetical protein
MERARFSLIVVLDEVELSPTSRLRRFVETARRTYVRGERP